MKERVGFIGLGTMGKLMATNLIKAGYPLVVYSRSRGPVEELEALGAQGARSSREVAEKTDLVVTMLPDSPDVIQVVLGAEGVLQGAKGGYAIIDMSTISPVAAQKIAKKASAKEVNFPDVPVSGGQEGAIEGSLSIMGGGRENGLREVHGHLQCPGNEHRLHGRHGDGSNGESLQPDSRGSDPGSVGRGSCPSPQVGFGPQSARESSQRGFRRLTRSRCEGASHSGRRLPTGLQGQAAPEGPEDSPGDRKCAWRSPPSDEPGASDVRCLEGSWKG